MASLKETLKTYSDGLTGNSIKELEAGIALDLVSKLPSGSAPAGLTAGTIPGLSRRRLEKLLFFADATEKVESRVAHIALKIVAYKAAVDSAEDIAAVQALIDALPEAASVAATDADEIAAARAAYEALTEAQQANVTITKLTAAEAALEALSTPSEPPAENP